MANKNYWKFFPYLIILLMALWVYVVTQSSDAKNAEINILKQNEKSLTDSIRISKNKIGELEYSKNILVGDVSDLKRNNRDLYELLKKTNGEVSELTQYIVNIDNKPSKPIHTEVIDYENFRYGLKWESDTIYNKDNSRHLAGESIFDVKFDGGMTKITPFETKITKDLTIFKVSQGLRKVGDNIEVFVTSDHPNFVISELNSVIIDPNEHVVKEFVKPDKKRFGLGFSVGYGATSKGLTPYVGVGLNYNAIRF